MSDIEYIVFFVDDNGDPEEWAASSTDFTDALHYLEIYSQDGDVGVFWQPNPKAVLVDGARVVMRQKK